MGASIAKLSAPPGFVSTSTTASKSPNSLVPLVDDIRQCAISDLNGHPTIHAQLLSKIQALNLAVETPLETIYRIGHQSWQNAAIRVGLDLGIFEVLVESAPRAISVEELALRKRADPVLVARIMRVITALGLCDEASLEKYSANCKTAIMTVPQGTASLKFWVDMAMPSAAKLPESLRMSDYRNPCDSKATAFAQAFGFEFWTYMKRSPEHAATFNGFMASRREGRPSWFDIYPVKEELSGLEGEDDVLLVDIGGNQGHDLVNLKAKYPDLQGRLILQDLPDVVAKLHFNHGNISAMGHDFFNAQPIQHARAYHFRAIFHDWADAECMQILKHTVSAMKPRFSKLLISEFVLTDTGTALFPASLDLQMMGLHAGMERSEKQWRGLLGEVGLEVVKIWRKVVGGESVIEARLI